MACMSIKLHWEKISREKEQTPLFHHLILSLSQYIDGCRSVDHVNCRQVTPVNRQRQSDGY